MIKPSCRASQPPCLLLVAALLGGPSPAAFAGGPAIVDEIHLEALALRPIGPYRGGRVTAVTGVRGDRLTFYMGSTGGGVWKTTDAGVRPLLAA